MKKNRPPCFAAEFRGRRGRCPRGQAAFALLLLLLTPAASRGQENPAIQPFYTNPSPTPSPAAPQVRRALPVNPSGPAPSVPVARAVPVEPAPRPSPTPSSTVTATAPPPEAPPPAPAVNQPAANSPAPAAMPTPTPAPVQRRGPPPGRPTPPPGSPPADNNNNTGGGDNGGEIRLAPSQSGGPTVTAEQLQLDTANRLYLGKQYDRAAAEYERFLGQYPEAPVRDRQSALWFMAESYRLLRRIPAALTTYETLLSQFEEGQFVGPASYQLAALYFEAKNYKAALPLFDKSAALTKNDEVLLASRYYQALCLEKLERRDETKDVYAKILAVTGNNPYRDTARVALARLAIDQKKPAEALEQYEALAKETNKAALKADAIIKAGLLARELGQNDKAIALLSRGATLIEAGQLRGTAQMELLHLFYDTNKYQKLLETYRALAPALPEDRRPEALLLVGNALRQLGQHKEALNLYDSLMTQYPNSPQVAEARYQRIISLYTTRNSNFVYEADDFLLLNSNPIKADEVKLMKADTLFRKEDYAAAAVAYTTVVTSPHLPPKYKAEALYRLGYAHTQSKQYENAIDAYTKFLKAYADHALVPKVLALRADANEKLKKYDEALADFQTLIDKSPGSREREIALEQKALILGQREDNKGMAETFRALLQDYPKTEYAGQAHFFLGMGAYNAKDFAAARGEFEAARKANAKEYGARASLRLILCSYQLQDKAQLAGEVDTYLKAKSQPGIPAQVLRWLGDRQLEDKNYAAAEVSLAAAAASPTSDAPDTWLKLARCRLLLKKPDGALEAARSYLEIAGANPSTRAGGLLAQGEAQVALRKYDEAEKSANEALQLQPEGTLNARARLLTGDIALARGNYDDAGKAYLSISILTDDPEITPQALRKAAEAFQKAGKPSEAAKALNELKARFPNVATQ